MKKRIDEAQVCAAMDAFYNGEDWRNNLGIALEPSLRDMRNAIQAALLTGTGESQHQERKLVAGIDLIRQAVAAGRFRIRCKDRGQSADTDGGMVWPMEIELPCINGLSCWFTIGNLYSPDAAAQGYTDGALSDDLARALADHITGSLASPPPPAGAAGGSSDDLGALSAGATADPAPNAAASHATNFRTLSVGAPTPDLGVQGEPGRAAFEAYRKAASEGYSERQPPLFRNWGELTGSERYSWAAAERAGHPLYEAPTPPSGVETIRQDSEGATDA